jgi:hypothetical protein
MDFLEEINFNYLAWWRWKNGSIRSR